LKGKTMAKEKAYQYDAFISYRHHEMDLAVATRLQQLLENHKKPDGTPVRVFRDQSELPTNSDLGKDIHDALEQSRYLIILCSKTYCESKYCMDELNYFRNLHSGSNQSILVMMLEGEPDEIFPRVIRFEEEAIEFKDGTTQVIEREVEPLAADVRADSIAKQLRKLKTEYLRIAAPILGCRFDDLYQRAERKRRTRILVGVSTVAILAILFGLYSMYMLDQIVQRQRRLEQKQAELYANESRRLANESMSIAQSNPNLALLLADTALPEQLEKPEYPIQAEAETAIRSAALHARIQEHDQGIRLNAAVDIEGDLGMFYDRGKYFVTSDRNHTRVYDARTAALLTVIDQTALLFSADAGRYYVAEESYADGGFQLDVHVYDTFSGKWLASYEVIREQEIVRYSMFLDERTDRVYIVRWYIGNEQIDAYGFIDRQDSFVKTDELPADAKERTLFGRQQGNVQQNCNFVVNDETAIAAIEAQLGSAYTVDALTSTWDKSLYLPVVSVWEKYGTFDYQDDDSVYILFAVEEMEDARIAHHPTNVPPDYFEPYIENGVERQRGYDSTVEGTFTVYVRGGQKTAVWDVNGQRILSLLDGNCFQRSENKLLYSEDDGQLKIYSYYPASAAEVQIDRRSLLAADGQTEDAIAQAIAGEEAAYAAPKYAFMSEDGKRVVAEVQDNVEIYDTDHLDNPLLSFYGGNGYTLTDDFAYALVKESTATISLYETGSGARLFTKEISQNSQTGFCVSGDGTKVAVATPLKNRAWRVEVYDVLSDVVTQTLEMTTEDSYGPYMEFSGDKLCVAFYSCTWLYDLSDPENPVRYTASAYAEGAFTQALPLSTAYQDNGLIVVPGLEESAYGTRYRVNSIIDPQNGRTIPFYSRYDAGVEGYCYDAETDTLVDQETNEFVVQRRNEQGAYEEVYRIASKGECRQIFMNMQVIGSGYLVVNGQKQTEIYRLENGALEYRIPHGDLHTPYYVIREGVLYDMNSQNGRIVRYPLPDTQTARTWVRGYLGENGKMKAFSDAECDAYYIPAEWQ